MTQQELADKLDISKQQINSYATGRRVMTYQVAYNIASALRCEMSELYEWKVAKDERE
jgi:transcriptional regulator with XRE-family HTH domain